MGAIGFDNQKYLTTQSEQIKKRIHQFGGKLYLEFGDDDLHIILQLLKHPDLAVRFKARQYPGGMIVVKR